MTPASSAIRFHSPSLYPKLLRASSALSHRPSQLTDSIRYGSISLHLFDACQASVDLVQPAQDCLYVATACSGSISRYIGATRRRLARCACHSLGRAGRRSRGQVFVPCRWVARRLACPSLARAIGSRGRLRSFLRSVMPLLYRSRHSCVKRYSICWPAIKLSRMAGPVNPLWRFNSMRSIGIATVAFALLAAAAHGQTFGDGTLIDIQPGIYRAPG